MDPAKPPLPTPMNLPFQFAAGSHISMLISESEVGFKTTCTLQCSGIFGCGAGAAPRAPPAPPPRAPPPPRAGAGPSGTTTALVMVALSNLRLVRSWHGDGAAVVAAPRSIKAMLAIMSCLLDVRSY